MNPTKSGFVNLVKKESKKDMKKFNGFLIENGVCERRGKFVVFGEMSDGTKCYHEIDKNGDEIVGAWYSRMVKKIDGKNYNLFFLEGIE